MSRLFRALGTLALACGWLVTAAPAAAVADWGVTDPESEALVDGPLDLAVFVEAAEGEQVQTVAVRFLRDGWPFGEGRILSHRAGPLSAGRSAWGSRLNPNASWVLGGQAMPNGLYDIQTRAKVLTSAGEQWTEWRGHLVALQVPPPATTLTVRRAGGGQVELAWRQIQLPDFVRYDVERSADGVKWVVVASTTDPDDTRIIDALPRGRSRYRMRVVRSDGQGGQLVTASTPVEINGLPAPILRSGSSHPAEVSGASLDEAPSGVVTLPRPLLPPARSTVPLEPAASQEKASAFSPPLAGIYHRTLPYPKVGRQVTEAQDAATDERQSDSSTISVAQSRLRDRQLLMPIAGGLLLMTIAGHIGVQLRRPAQPTGWVRSKSP